MKKIINHNIQTMKSNWYMWLFPVFAIAISAVLFSRYYFEKGQVIKISFEEASVIEPEKTRLRFRGVTVGTVKQVVISEDTKSVIVSALLKKGSEEFAVSGTKFWLVSPKVNLQGLTGLDTIFEGPYISVLPGSPDGAFETNFKARVGTEATEALENTSVYDLITPTSESVSAGDSVTFRGLNVGSVTKVALMKSGQAVSVQLNIQNKYSKLIRSNTSFWRKVGIQANFGLFGSSVKVNSLDSIMHGGVEFATPNPPGEIARHLTFPLLQTAPKDYDKWNPKIDY
jgi:paraquat-inducible protein B